MSAIIGGCICFFFSFFIDPSTPTELHYSPVHITTDYDGPRQELRPNWSSAHVSERSGEKEGGFRSKSPERHGRLVTKGGLSSDMYDSLRSHEYLRRKGQGTHMYVWVQENRTIRCAHVS